MLSFVCNATIPHLSKSLSSSDGISYWLTALIFLEFCISFSVSSLVIEGPVKSLPTATSLIGLSSWKSSSTYFPRYFSFCWQVCLSGLSTATPLAKSRVACRLSWPPPAFPYYQDYLVMLVDRYTRASLSAYSASLWIFYEDWSYMCLFYSYSISTFVSEPFIFAVIIFYFINFCIFLYLLTSVFLHFLCSPISNRISSIVHFCFLFLNLKIICVVSFKMFVILSMFV